MGAVGSLSYYSFFLPVKIVFGCGSFKEVGKEVKKLGINKPLIVTDRNMVKAGFVEDLANYLKSFAIKFGMFEGVEPEPKVETAEEIASEVRRGDYDSVISLGGGSVMDMGKVASLAKNNLGPVVNYLGSEKVRNFCLPNVCIPTTAGTGSEVTDRAMVTVGNDKKVIASKNIFPKVAIVDPELCKSMPPRVTASTGLDALSHAIEGFLSKDSNPITDMFAREAVKNVFKYLKRAYSKGDDVEAREGMCKAALFAGIAIQAKMIYGHSIGYTIATKYSLPHGVSCAIPLPYVIEHTLPVTAPKVAELANIVGLGADEEVMKKAYSFIRAVKDLVAGLNIPTSLKEVGVPKGMLEELARECLAKWPRENHPVEMSINSMVQLYENIWEGKLSG